MNGKDKPKKYNRFLKTIITKLSRLRPGMIEDRANNKTAEVFRAVEQDSKDVANLDEVREKATMSN